MAFSDLFGGIVDKISGVLEHKDTAIMLLKYFNLDVIKHLADGRLLVSEDVIRSQMQILEEPGVVLKELQCRPDDFLLVLQVTKHGAALEVQMRLQIRKLVLTEAIQTLVLHITEEKSPVGKNFFGKVAGRIGNALVGSLTNYALKSTDLGEHTHYDEGQKLITVNLGKLPDLRPLLEPIDPSREDSVPLRWLGIENATHVAGGVELHLFVSQAAKDSYQDLVGMIDDPKKALDESLDDVKKKLTSLFS
jgi:hypothetical protein